MEKLLEFKNISLLRDRLILKNISFDIAQGENVVILGPNGAGKSSIIKLITREYYPLADRNSSLKILGQERWEVSKLRSQLGIVSNDLQFICTRSISGLDTVISGFFGAIGLCSYHKVTLAMRKKAAQIIDFLEISDLKNKMMDAMSSGEARRFLIARALVHDPKTLILDEPMTSLDLHASLRFTAVLRKIARQGIGIILVTHNIQDIIPEISRVIMIKDGAIYKDGSKDEFLTTKNICRLFNCRVDIRQDKDYYYWVR